jgi:2-polyprenyl-3-methyl-5-hydroxy-6-metoxy-1,4-benzoquinol methylase
MQAEGLELDTCPICRRGHLEDTGFAIAIPDVLRRWEEAMKHPLPEKVWKDYQTIGDRPIKLFECSECRFGRFDPVLPGTENFYEAISATDYYNADKWEFSRASRDILASGAKRILDVGCGSGIFLDFLRKKIPEGDLFGFDLNAELLRELSGRGFGTLPNEPRKFDDAMAGKPLFDAISMLQVLEHVADPVEFLQTFLPLLRPGGLLIITTPNFDGPIRKFGGALTEVPPHHTTRWTDKSFRSLLSMNRLAVEDIGFEPLPDYLWDSYLPEVWDKSIWPALIFDPIARRRGLVSVGERSGMAAQAMRSAGIRWLEGVAGHTIYVAARSIRSAENA